MSWKPDSMIWVRNGERVHDKGGGLRSGGLEVIMNTLPEEVKICVREQKPKTCKKTVGLDNY